MDTGYLNPCLNPGEEIRAFYIPEHAYNFQPQHQDIIMEVEGKAQRMIFHRVTGKLQQRELTALEGFRQYLKEQKLSLPHGYDDQENLVQRFLEGAQWRNKEAYEQLMNHHRFT